jgi:hypothetical protein
MPTGLGLGPVFACEWLRICRRWQMFAVRSLFVAGLLAGILLVWFQETADPTVSPIRSQARIGEALFYTVIGIQLTLVLLAALAATAGADLVVTTRAISSDDFVSVLFGNGDGTFQAPVNYPLTMYPQSVTVADLEGHGRPDLMVESHVSVNGSPLGTQILLNNGDGTFSSTDILPVTHSVAGYFTDDGNLGIAGVSNRDTINVYLGNGDGTFQAPVSSHVDGEGVFSLAVGDFNGDGIQDLAATVFGEDGSGQHSTTAYGLLGQGDGTFQEVPARLPIFRYGATPTFVALADFYGDGLPGLIEGDSSFHDVVVLRSVGDGSFRIADSFPSVFAGGSLIATVGDFNGDGLPDFAVASDTTNPIDVFLNAGDGGSRGGAVVSGPAGSRIFGDHPSEFAAIDGLFADARPQSVSPVAGQQLAAPAVGTAFTASRPEAATWLQPSQAVADTGTMHHQHQEDRVRPVVDVEGIGAEPGEDVHGARKSAQDVVGVGAAAAPEGQGADIVVTDPARTRA